MHPNSVYTPLTVITPAHATEHARLAASWTSCSKLNRQLNRDFHGLKLYRCM